MKQGKEATETMLTRLPGVVAQRVRQIALDEDRSLSSVVRRLVMKALEMEERKG